MRSKERREREGGREGGREVKRKEETEGVSLKKSSDLMLQ